MKMFPLPLSAAVAAVVARRKRQLLLTSHCLALGHPFSRLHYCKQGEERERGNRESKSFQALLPISRGSSCISESRSKSASAAVALASKEGERETAACVSAAEVATCLPPSSHIRSPFPLLFFPSVSLLLFWFLESSLLFPALMWIRAVHPLSRSLANLLT